MYWPQRDSTGITMVMHGHNDFVKKRLFAQNCGDCGSGRTQPERLAVTFLDQTASNSFKIVFVLTVS